MPNRYDTISSFSMHSSARPITARVKTRDKPSEPVVIDRFVAGDERQHPTRPG
jgi:hypothetical protein